MKYYTLYMLIIVVLLIVSSTTTTVLSQNPYLQEVAIGNVPDTAKCIFESVFEYRPSECLIGEKFIFLPMNPQSQKYGYQLINGGLKYEQYVGRIMTLKTVTAKQYGQSAEALFVMDDNQEPITKSIYSDDFSIMGIGPVADIDSARVRWLNKTLWYTHSQIVYQTADGEFHAFEGDKFTPVKVVNIVAGTSNMAPVRFIISNTENNQGFVDVNLSGTNVSEMLRRFNKFEEYFLEEDPRLTREWPLHVWDAIKEGKVFIGMTKEQATWGWGTPKSVNRTTSTNSKVREQWVYSSGSYLYFEDDLLTTIQN